MDQFENQPQQPDTSQDTNGTSRRKFLKVAVVSSAAAAAAVGGAGVAATALSARNSGGLSRLFVLTNTNLVSTTNACFTNSAFQDVPSLNGQEGAYIWAWFTLPPAAAGQLFTVSLAAPDPLPSYITYQGSKQQKVFKNLSGCQDQGTAPSDDAKIGLGQDALPFQFTVPSGTNTVLVQVHVNIGDKNNPAPAGTITFTVELSGPSYDQTATTSVTIA
ncbi:MAG TPA: hypothetical protein VFQ25_08125 [Ktedonobacterales bacterium]|nr:hypothetical protein [Ktedonobacterales bacterium]